MAWLALVLLWPALAAAAAPAAQPLVLDDKQPSVNAWHHVRMLSDASRYQTVQNVLGRLPEFTRPTGAEGALGVRQDAAWLHVPLTVAQAPAHPWILSIDYPVLNEVDVYLASDGTVVQQALMGNLRPFSDRPLRGRDAMRALAYTDALTGLPNRRGLPLALNSAISLCAPNRLVAVYLLDLDGLPINDLHGHDVGDNLLVAVSHRMQDHVHCKTDVVARLGGDEFIIMAANLARAEQAEDLGNALLHSFREPFVMSHLQMHLGLTIGYALAPIDAAEPRELIRLADAAMYKGKQHGKHCLIRNDASVALSA